MRQGKRVHGDTLKGARETIQTSYISPRIYETFPFEDTRETGATMHADQFRVALAVAEISPKELCELFWLKRRAVRRFANDELPIPRGIADYLRMKVAARVRAMAIATGTPIATSEEFNEPPGDAAAAEIFAMIESLTRKTSVLEQRGMSREEVATLRRDTQTRLAEVMQNGGQDCNGVRHVVREFDADSGAEQVVAEAEAE